MKKKWSVSDISNTIQVRSNIIEFQDNVADYHVFDFIVTPEKIVFGGFTNTGFLESGYIERWEGENIDITLQDLLYDLETYYNDGANYTTRIIYNDLM